MEVVHPGVLPRELLTAWTDLRRSEFGALTMSEITPEVVDHVIDRSSACGLGEVAATLRRQLDDPGQGYAYVDLSGLDCTTVKERALATTLATVALFRSVARPTTDPRNRTPFNIYKSSAERAAAMRRAGIHFYTPDEHIGFHNDALVSGPALRLPRYVGLMNLFMGYSKPGHFFWLPVRRWSERPKWIDQLGLEARAVVDTTPVIYESELDAEGTPSGQASGEFDVSLFPGLPKVGTGLFMNGTIREVVDATGHPVPKGAERLQDSLMASAGRIALPQRPGRLILLRNDLGVHSREVLDGQVVFRGVTRLLLRIMSQEATEVGQRLTPTT